MKSTTSQMMQPVHVKAMCITSKISYMCVKIESKDVANSNSLVSCKCTV